MSLLHAVTVLLTVVLFVVRLRCALAALFTEKRCSIRQQGSQHESGGKAAGRRDSEHSTLAAVTMYLADPKYKRDPEIDVDSEEIGHEPLL